jgi:NAD(P)-dependent dehydrogenase (short-subunit alcohol dehydrogenase family)
MFTFSKKDIYLVTGASSGIGFAISKFIANSGATIVASGRNLDKLNELKENTDSSDIYIEEKDLSESLDDLSSWIDQLVVKYGKFKGIVYSAGLQETRPIQAFKIDDAKKVFDINYFGFISLVKAFSKPKNNIGNGSSIICISSIASKVGLPATVNYSASKGAINSAVKCLAVELANKGIRVNSILSGHILTDMITNEKNINTDKYIKKLESKYPLGLGKPENIADLAAFLLSDRSSWITGTNIVIDGGASLVF